MKIIKQTTYKLLRKKYIKSITNNFGIISETDDEITIYIDKEEGNTLKGEVKFYGNFEIDKTYIGDKKVTIILDGVTFNNVKSFYSSYNIVFKNCTFKKGVVLTSAKDITLYKNNYDVDSYVYGFRITASNIYLNKERIKIGGEYNKNKCITLLGDNIYLNDVRIYTTENYDTIDIDCKFLDAEYSIISSKYIYLKSDIINTNTVCLGVKNENLSIITTSTNNIGEICASNVLYNGNDISGVKYISDESLALYKARKVLTHSLSAVRDKCIDIKVEEVLKR